jgi:hypothetical protein
MRLLKRLNFPGSVYLMFFLSILAKSVSASDDLPPYQFCDETLYHSEVLRMSSEDDFVHRQFRAGGFNTYPIFILIQLFARLLDFKMNSLEVLILGRTLLAVLLPSISLFFIYKIALFFANTWVAKFVTLLYALSLFHYAGSWYPDTYINFGVSGFLYFLLKPLLKGDYRIRSFVFLGVFLGLSISTKFTTIGLFAPTILLFFYMYRIQRTNLGQNSIYAVSSFLVSFILFNPGIFLDTRSFVHGFLFNLDNYEPEGGTRFSGFIYYLGILTINSFGVVGFIYLVLGIIKNHFDKIVLVLLLSYPVLLILVLGDKKWVIARNMSSATVFIIPFVAIGFDFIIKKLQFYMASGKYMLLSTFSGLVLLSFFIPMASFGYVIQKDLKVDTRLLSEEWISDNISTNSSIGVNESCSGLSPAQVSGFRVNYDPWLNDGFDYYIINSYWSSPFSSEYSKKGVLSLIDQSKIHFEQWNSTRLIGSIGEIQLSKVKLPQNYKIVKIYRGNGPDMIILKKFHN